MDIYINEGDLMSKTISQEVIRRLKLDKKLR